MSNLNKRDIQAIEILKQGGYFRKALERDRYTQREQFEIRLRDINGNIIKGIGFATKEKLSSLGLLMRKECFASTVYPSESQLSYAVKFALILCGEI